MRKANVNVTESLSKDSLKSQLGKADKIGVEYTLILGQKEALDGTIIMRDMKTGRQETVKIDRVVDEIKKRLRSKSK